MAVAGAAREAYERDGFVHLAHGIPPALLAELRRGAEPILALHARDQLRDARRHQTILQPEVYHPSFLAFLNLPELNRLAFEVMGTEEIFFAELALLVGSHTHDLCGWHRDFSDDSPQIAEMIERPRLLIQYNAALYDDRNLWVIPGSHRRATLAAERAWASRFNQLGFFDDFEKAAAVDPNVLPGMPGGMNVRLAAGDVLLYNPILWHAAEYPAGEKRATLHGTWKPAVLVDQFTSLQWGFNHNPWLFEPGYLGELGPYVGAQLPRLVAAMRRIVPAFAGR